MDEASAEIQPGRARGEGPTAVEVTERLRHQIQEGLWSPGEWLRETRLCAEFGVGRSIVRRALGNLADDGLVHPGAEPRGQRHGHHRCRRCSTSTNCAPASMASPPASPASAPPRR